ncbi:MAG: hypothetical protein P1T08_00365 [Acidimicrobiia bacterium]|nr:hypothetical protein [Acidimicrobiia bacterium]
MDRPPTFAPVALLAAAAAWTLTLAFGEPTIGSSAAAVAAIDLLLVTVTAIVGIVVARARWARRYALVIICFMGAMALTMQISNNWIVALALTGLAVVAVTGPSLDGYLPERSVAGPPPKAVALPLLLLLFPGVAAFASGSPVSVAAWLVIGGTPVVAWAYGKAYVAGLWAARVAVPIAAMAMMWSLDPWSMVLLSAAVAGEFWLAWSGEAALAIDVSDQIRLARSIPIPPELTPPEVLAAAGVDEHGMRLPDPASESSEEEGGE